MNSFLITRCQVEDVDRIREIQKEVWLATYPNKEHGITKELILAYFQDKEKTYNWITSVKESLRKDKNTSGWIAKIDNVIIGYSFAKKMEDKNRIMSLYILLEYQGKGIGKALMGKMLEWIDTSKPTVLEVAQYNINAIAFYKAFGFKENGPIKNEVASVSTGVVIPEIEMIKSADKSSEL